NFFRETSGIQRLPDLLITDPSQTAGAAQHGHPENNEDFEWTAQHARNMLVVLDIIRMLIQPGNTNTESNQTAMQQNGIIPPLLQLALAYEAPSSVRAQALYAIGDIIRLHAANQGLFQRILITAAPADDDSEEANEKAIPEPAAMIVIRLAVGARPSAVPTNEYYIVRSAAAYLVQAYVGGNPDAQLALAATLTPPDGASGLGNPDTHQSAGSLIVSVLLDWRETGKEDVWRVWHASLLLSTVLRGYEQCKVQALRVSLGDESKGEDPLPLINELLSQARHATQESADARVCIALLALVCVWVVDFPQAVTTLLDESTNTSFLVEQINGSSGVNTLVQGVAAFLFGLIYQFDTDAESPVTRNQLYPILSKRVGTDQLLIRVQRLRDSKEFQYALGLTAGTHSNAYGGVPNELFFDNVFTDLFRAHYELFRAAVRLGPQEAQLAPAAFAHLQGGMAGYAGSGSAPGSIPGTPQMNQGNMSRSMSPGIAQDSVTDNKSSVPSVPKSEFDALDGKVREQAAEIERLSQALAEQKKVADEERQQREQEKEAGKQAHAQDFYEQLSQLAEVEGKVREQAEEIDQLNQALADQKTQKQELETLHAQLADAEAKASQSQSQANTSTESEEKLAELEQKLSDLTLDAEQKQAAWDAEREELARKLATAEKQVVKAAAAGRNLNKKKEMQQAGAIEALEKNIQEKDAKIAALTSDVEQLKQRAAEAESLDELKERLATAEKEQEDLLVYLADQDQQAK
ncbi:Vesicle-mediated ER to Golgi transport protein, partial [Linderina macrospora]